jgi:hypothetical protein
VTLPNITGSLTPRLVTTLGGTQLYVAAQQTATFHGIQMYVLNLSSINYATGHSELGTYAPPLIMAGNESRLFHRGGVYSISLGILKQQTFSGAVQASSPDGGTLYLNSRGVRVSDLSTTQVFPFTATHVVATADGARVVIFSALSQTWMSLPVVP